MGYEGNNLYTIHHLLKQKIYKTQDVDINKSLLYNKSNVKPWELADEK